MHLVNYTVIIQSELKCKEVRFDLDRNPDQGFTVICEIESIIGIRSEGMKGEFAKGVLTCGDH